MPERVVETPSGTKVNIGLGFTARSIVVDNWTNQYVRLPAAGQTILPYTVGAVRKCEGTTSAELRFEAPGGYAEPATVAGETVEAIFTSEDLAYAAGTSVAPSTAALPQVVKSSDSEASAYTDVYPIGGKTLSSTVRAFTAIAGRSLTYVSITEVAKPVDLFAVSTPAAGAQATVTFAGSVGAAHMLTYLAASIFGSGGLGATSLQILDAATVISSVDMSVPAINNAQQNPNPSPNVQAAVGDAMTVQFAAAVANLSQKISAGVTEIA